MSYDYSLLFQNIIAAVSGGGSFEQRMNALITHCENQIPNKGWSGFREIDYEADNDRLKHWLPLACAEAVPSTLYKGIWFGLNNPVINGEPTADIYLAASQMFDRGSIDWAASASFYPVNGYLGSQVLSSIYRLAHSGSGALQNYADYPLVLAYGAMAARAALENTEFSGVFAQLNGAAVGFDSGDLLILGSFHGGSFETNVEIG